MVHLSVIKILRLSTVRIIRDLNRRFGGLQVQVPPGLRLACCDDTSNEAPAARDVPVDPGPWCSSESVTFGGSTSEGRSSSSWAGTSGLETWSSSGQVQPVDPRAPTVTSLQVGHVAISRPQWLIRSP